MAAAPCMVFKSTAFGCKPAFQFAHVHEHNITVGASTVKPRSLAGKMLLTPLEKMLFLILNTA
jgi:hypothetical protein